MLDRLPGRVVSFQIRPGPATTNRQSFESAELFLSAYAGSDARGRPRHVVQWGDSKYTLPRAVAAGTTFDLNFIDGAHSYRTASADLMNARLLSRLSAMVIMDDCFPHLGKCSAALAKLQSWQRGPTRAWNKAVASGQLLMKGYSEGLAWGEFRDSK